MSKFGIVVFFIIVVMVLTAGVLWLIHSGDQNGTVTPTNSVTRTSSNTVPTLVLGVPTGTAPGTIPQEPSTDENTTARAMSLKHALGKANLQTIRPV